MTPVITDEDRRYMAQAARLAEENVARGGGPFAAVIVRDGKVLATGCNSVTLDNDPTAHAEINAVREACRQAGSFRLEGAAVYTSCEPCPMCLAALYWAGVSRIYYGNTQRDADAIGFGDHFIYRQIATPATERAVPCIRIDNTDTPRAFRLWETKADRTEY